MDQFGVLVESIGFKSQSKSAPLADLKGNNNINNGFSRNSDYNSKTPSNSGDGVFGLKNDQKTQNYNGFDDVFGGLNMYDLDSVFAGSNNSGAKSSGFDNGDDIFGGFQTSKSSDSMNSSYKHNNLNDDLLGGFTDLGSKPNSVNMGKNGTAFDELITGFGGSSPSSNGTKSEKNSSQHPSDQSAKYNKALVEDPFNIFESSSVQRNNTSTLISDPLSQGARNIPVRSSIDELEDFATGRMRSDANESSDTPSPQEVKTSIKATKARTEARSRQGKEVGEKENKAKQKSVYSGHKETEKRRAQNRVEEDNPASANVDHLESFFSMGSKSRNATSPRSVTEDAVYDTLFQKSKASPDQRFGTSPTIKKNSPKRNVDNDFSFLFGVEVAPSSGAFQEIKGESEERRRARLNHHKNTQDRMAKALNEKNQRDLRLQMEQDERHRLAATLDDRIKRWAAGKEGNLRALLSSLQDVLWPECGWRPVSLTDLITSVSVKKVYQKATLCVHPDKVQQKGANLQQKYIAEKVFDLLKEAYTKFSSEEL